MCARTRASICTDALPKHSVRHTSMPGAHGTQPPDEGVDGHVGIQVAALNPGDDGVLRG